MASFAVSLRLRSECNFPQKIPQRLYGAESTSLHKNGLLISRQISRLRHFISGFSTTRSPLLLVTCASGGKGFGSKPSQQRKTKSRNSRDSHLSSFSSPEAQVIHGRDAALDSLLQTLIQGEFHTLPADDDQKTQARIETERALQQFVAKQKDKSLRKARRQAERDELEDFMSQMDLESSLSRLQFAQLEEQGLLTRAPASVLETSRGSKNTNFPNGKPPLKHGGPELSPSFLVPPEQEQAWFEEWAERKKRESERSGDWKEKLKTESILKEMRKQLRNQCQSDKEGSWREGERDGRAREGEGSWREREGKGRASEGDGSWREGEGRAREGVQASFSRPGGSGKGRGRDGEREMSAIKGSEWREKRPERQFFGVSAAHARRGESRIRSGETGKGGEKGEGVSEWKRAHLEEERGSSRETTNPEMGSSPSSFSPFFAGPSSGRPPSSLPSPSSPHSLPPGAVEVRYSGQRKGTRATLWSSAGLGLTPSPQTARAPPPFSQRGGGERSGEKPTYGKRAEDWQMHSDYSREGAGEGEREGEEGRESFGEEEEERERVTVGTDALTWLRESERKQRGGPSVRDIGFGYVQKKAFGNFSSENSVERRRIARAEKGGKKASGEGGAQIAKRGKEGGRGLESWSRDEEGTREEGRERFGESGGERRLGETDQSRERKRTEGGRASVQGLTRFPSAHGVSAGSSFSLSPSATRSPTSPFSPSSSRCVATRASSFPPDVSPSLSSSPSVSSSPPIVSPSEEGVLRPEVSGDPSRSSSPSYTPVPPPSSSLSSSPSSLSPSDKGYAEEGMGRTHPSKLEEDSDLSRLSPSPSSSSFSPSRSPDPLSSPVLRTAFKPSVVKKRNNRSGEIERGATEWNLKSLPKVWDGPGGVVMLIDKPKGWTSFAVCAKVRALLKIRKVGHAGTLDPLATGLLVVCAGKATKQVDSYQAMRKEYSGRMRMGEGTPSLDSDTPVSQSLPWEHIRDDDLEEAAKKFLGDSLQVPPMYSAIQVKGERMYEKARRGESVALEPRPIRIEHFEVSRSDNRQEFDFRVVCSKGTYVRSLCLDFAASLDSVCHLVALRREAIGELRVDVALTVEELQQLYRMQQELGSMDI